MQGVVIALFAVFAGLHSSTSQAQTETVTYYHTDAIGSVRMVTDATGQVLGRYDYQPFGLPLAQTPPPPAEQRQFAGKERDPETSFDYFGGRYYQSLTGRFTTVDPVLDVEQALVDPQRWNRYAYVRNSPFRYVDPDGRQFRVTVYGEYTEGQLEQHERHREWVRQRLSGLPAVGGVVDQGLSLFLPVTPQEQANALSMSLMPIAGMSVGGHTARFISKWGWTGGAAWRDAVRLVKQGGTIKEIGGKIPSKQEALQLLRDAGATVNRIELPHQPPNPHSYPHINYSTPSGTKGTVRIEAP